MTMTEGTQVSWQRTEGGTVSARDVIRVAFEPVVAPGQLGPARSIPSGPH
jgi:hypothetical protein